MRAVRSTGNKSTELSLIYVFRNNSIKGWRRNYKLLGSPDFVFPKKRIVVFADGCFWHGHNCRNTKPENHADYWEKKIRRNKSRDKFITKALKQAGWHVIRIWECEIKKSKLPKNLKTVFKKK
ncbi:MAG: very short patch repair endonuclease [Candidatus Zixiibacteriota bacterium]|jgi:DNA mismatch endonuclease (patch repair protein)